MTVPRHFGLGLAACGLGLLLAGCRGHGPALAELAEARRLTDDLRTQLAKASDASDRAVLADTDEASAAFAKDAERALQIIDDESAALGTHLGNLAYPAETQALADFTSHFAAYRKLERDVLDLAVQNTNLKAQRLSFGPVREAADAFHEALTAAGAAASTKDRCRVDGLAAHAELAVRQIEILQAPHIAEADDAAMSRLEAQMAARLAEARQALGALGATPAAAPKIPPATAALDRFEKLSNELIALSRRNSNVRSMELALRQTPALTAACDASLTTLQDALAKEALGGTR